MISAIIESLEQNQVLYRVENFVERMKALDALELHLLDEGDNSLTDAEQWRFRRLKQKLDAANERLFAYLLERIHAHDWAIVKQTFQQAEQQISRRTGDDDVGYDEIDMLVNGLLEVALVPEESREREADMLFYQPTPARIVLKLIDELHLTAEDVFYDLGSGLGHVPILMTLLTGIRTKGVERDDAYIHYSDERIKKLALDKVAFIHADVRHADYTDGTIFYLYTPFRGELLHQVMAMLAAQARQRPIRVCAYGPCTLEVSRQKWLRPIYETGKRENRFGIFVSD